MTLSEEMIIIISATTSFACLLITVLNYLSKNRNTKYNDLNHRIEIDKSREYYEKRLFRLQTELLENQRRWTQSNNLIIEAQNKNNSNSNIIPEVFLKNFGINKSEINENPKSVFFLTPFMDGELETFEVVKSICSDVNLNCTRGDEIYREKDILHHVIVSIIQSSVVIANLNGRNSNVYYELGICHSIGKPVILISKNRNISFDVQGKNIIFYKNYDILKDKLKDELLKIFINNNEKATKAESN